MSLVHEPLQKQVVMEALGPSITNSYKDVYALDPRFVSVVGMIKDLVVKLSTFPQRSIFMDMNVVVAYIPPSFGMILCRKWSASSIQMDWSYTMIPVGDK
jgi:hypothetical protein